MPLELAVISLGLGAAAIVVAALVDAVARARRLRRQRALQDLATLSWQAFEEVIADAFRRHGYRVREVGGRGRADGGVDVVLERDGETTIVQASTGAATGSVWPSSGSCTECSGPCRRTTRCSWRRAATPRMHGNSRPRSE